MDSPRFTVYIPSHNKGKYLTEAIESVLRQSARDWELLILDVGSTDSTAEVMRLYRGDERIRLFSLEKTPLPTVCNLALANSRGKYFIRLDGDDYFDDNILLVLGAYLDNHPETALVFPDYYHINAVGDILSMQTRPRIFHGDHIMDQPPNGACTMIRTEVLNAFNGYREDLGAQDGLDLWSKTRNAGHLAANVNLPLFYYRLHDTNLTNDSAHILHSQRGIRMEHGLRDLDSYRPIIAAIPCRRHYDFTPDLWKERLNGKTLLEIKVEACLGAAIFDHVVVYCDNPDAGHVLEKYGDSKLSFMSREKQTTIRSVNLAMALRPLARNFDPDFTGSTVVNYIQTPFVTSQTLEHACFSLAAIGADSSLGVEEMDSPLFKRTPLGLAPLNPGSAFCPSHERFYRETRSCLATRNRNLRDGSLRGARVTSFNMTKDEALFIDSPRMLRIARLLQEMDGCGSR